MQENKKTIIRVIDTTQPIKKLRLIFQFIGNAGDQLTKWNLEAVYNATEKYRLKVIQSDKANYYLYFLDKKRTA